MTTTSTKPWDEEYATEIRKKLRGLCDQHTNATLALCEILFKAYHAVVKTNEGEIPVHQAWKFESFDAYVEDELEIHHGTAMAYINIWDELYIRRSFDPGVLPNSITKLRQLARISRKYRGDMRNMLRWVARSKENNCCDFENLVDQEFGERGKRKGVLFTIKWARLRPLMKAIEEAKEQFGVSTKGEALTQIVEQWASLRPQARKTG